MPTKKILIINGHPDKESFNSALVEAYKKGALSANADVKEIHVRDLKFNPNLQFGYRRRKDLEPDLLKAQEQILWVDHLVWVYPVWWGSLPAILKGFIDRVFLPGFAFRKRENSVWWDKLLKNKTDRIISTMDQPNWYYWLVYGQPSHNAMKKLTLEFSGIAPVKITSIGPIRLSKESYRKNWLEKIEKLGQSQKSNLFSKDYFSIPFKDSKMQTVKTKKIQITLAVGFLFLSFCSFCKEKPKTSEEFQATEKQTKNQTAAKKYNPVVYFEIPVRDMERAIQFYKSVFHFEFEKTIIDENEMALFPFTDTHLGISGALAKGKIYRPTKEGVLLYFKTETIEETLQLATKNGGKILYPKTSNGELGFVAEFEDSEGNRIGLHQSVK